MADKIATQIYKIEWKNLKHYSNSNNSWTAFWFGTEAGKESPSFTSQSYFLVDRLLSTLSVWLNVSLMLWNGLTLIWFHIKWSVNWFASAVLLVNMFKFTSLCLPKTRQCCSFSYGKRCEIPAVQWLNFTIPHWLKASPYVTTISWLWHASLV